jgi:hypothetical protein
MELPQLSLGLGFLDIIKICVDWIYFQRKSQDNQPNF